MCQEAARITDPCVHGGAVAMGSLNVVIGALNAARKGDAHTCPIHPPGKIVSASKTVLINGVGAARRLDTIQCATPPTPAGGVGAIYDVDGNTQAKVLYAEGKISKDGSGNVTGMEGQVGLSHAEMSGQSDSGVGGGFKLDAMYARAKVSADYGGAQLDAKAAAVTGEATLYNAPKGDKYNPYESTTVQGNLFSAQAQGNALAGYDGHRVGVVAYGRAGAQMASGSVAEERGIPIPFTNWSIDIKGKLSGSVGSVGIGGGAGAYWDMDESRFHLMGLLRGEFLAGLGLNLDISIGKKFQAPPPPPAPAPDAISQGLSTVFFGG
jgi:uncharacterized Zn-binding protein involved in type VI secretion